MYEGDGGVTLRDLESLGFPMALMVDRRRERAWQGKE